MSFFLALAQAPSCIRSALSTNVASYHSNGCRPLLFKYLVRYSHACLSRPLCIRQTPVKHISAFSRDSTFLTSLLPVVSQSHTSSSRQIIHCVSKLRNHDCSAHSVLIFLLLSFLGSILPWLQKKLANNYIHSLSKL